MVSRRGGFKAIAGAIGMGAIAKADDVRTMSAGPGDTIVIRFREGIVLEANQIEMIRRQMEHFFPGRQTLVLCDGADIAVMRGKA
jgi:hypothetical protein